MPEARVERRGGASRPARLRDGCPGGAVLRVRSELLVPVPVGSALVQVLAPACAEEVVLCALAAGDALHGGGVLGGAGRDAEFLERARGVLGVRHVPWGVAGEGAHGVAVGLHGGVDPVDAAFLVLGARLDAPVARVEDGVVALAELVARDLPRVVRADVLPHRDGPLLHRLGAVGGAVGRSLGSDPQGLAGGVVGGEEGEGLLHVHGDAEQAPLVRVVAGAGVLVEVPGVDVHLPGDGVGNHVQDGVGGVPAVGARRLHASEGGVEVSGGGALHVGRARAGAAGAFGLLVAERGPRVGLVHELVAAGRRPAVPLVGERLERDGVGDAHEERVPLGVRQQRALVHRAVVHLVEERLAQGALGLVGVDVHPHVAAVDLAAPAVLDEHAGDAVGELPAVFRVRLERERRVRAGDGEAAGRLPGDRVHALLAEEVRELLDQELVRGARHLLLSPLPGVARVVRRGLGRPGAAQAGGDAAQPSHRSSLLARSAGPAW